MQCEHHADLCSDSAHRAQILTRHHTAFLCSSSTTTEDASGGRSLQHTIQTIDRLTCRSSTSMFKRTGLSTSSSHSKNNAPVSGPSIQQVVGKWYRVDASIFTQHVVDSIKSTGGAATTTTTAPSHGSKRKESPSPTSSARSSKSPRNANNYQMALSSARK